MTAWGQVDSVDIWISEIQNNQLQGVCHFFWTLEIKSDAKSVHKLIDAGKPVADKLINKLTDQNKGIICHYMLSKILDDSLTIESSFADTEINYRVNSLKVKEKDGRLTASKAHLDKIKNYWINRQRTKK